MVLGVVKRNPLFLHEMEWKNNGFLFTISNIRFVIGQKFMDNDGTVRRCVIMAKSTSYF